MLRYTDKQLPTDLQEAAQTNVIDLNRLFPAVARIEAAENQCNCQFYI